MRRRLAFPPRPSPPPSPLERVAATSRALDRSRQARDSAIRVARASRLPFREIAAAAGLGLTRVQQIAGGPHTGLLSVRDAIPELDTLGWHPGADADVDQEDRVVALTTVATWLETHPSEQAFLKARPERLRGDRYDFSFAILDLEPVDDWVITFIDSTHEVYAFATTAPTGRPSAAAPDEDPRLGSRSGPCRLLGHAFSFKLLDAAMSTAISAAAGRPGGLAWVYGRVQLLNRILDALPNPPKDVKAYLELLAGLERSGRHA